MVQRLLNHVQRLVIMRENILSMCAKPHEFHKDVTCLSVVYNPHIPFFLLFPLMAQLTTI